jgi:hypothetical protein
MRTSVRVGAPISRTITRDKTLTWGRLRESNQRFSPLDCRLSGVRRISLRYLRKLQGTEPQSQTVYSAERTVAAASAARTAMSGAKVYFPVLIEI